MSDGKDIDGDFMRNLKFVVEQDLKMKRKVLKNMVENPEKYPPMTGEMLSLFLFGNYQEFVDKFGSIE
jgi:hypothetical protein